MRKCMVGTSKTRGAAWTTPRTISHTTIRGGWGFMHLDEELWHWMWSRLATELMPLLGQDTFINQSKVKAWGKTSVTSPKAAEKYVPFPLRALYHKRIAAWLLGRETARVTLILRNLQGKSPPNGKATALRVAVSRAESTSPTLAAGTSTGSVLRVWLREDSGPWQASPTTAAVPT